MSIMVDVQHIKSAKPRELDGFSTVKVSTAAGMVTLYFKPGKAQAVADAINAALAVEVPA